jgi:hypothetical protein
VRERVQRHYAHDACDKRFAEYQIYQQRTRDMMKKPHKK